MDMPGPVWQWAGLVATCVGTVLSLWAALAASAAQRQARRAADAALRLGRVFRWNDLAADLQELAGTVSAAQFGAIATVSIRLRGRIARLSAESYDEMSIQDRERLTAVLGTLTAMSEYALSRRGTENSRLSRIRASAGEVTESLNYLIGTQNVVVGEELTGDERSWLRKKQ